MNILAIDPGKQTGFATWVNDEFTSWREPWDQAQDTVYTEIVMNEQRGRMKLDLVVFEDFVITGRTLKTGGSWKRGRELEFIGMARYVSKITGMSFEMQTPADAITWSTDAKLKALGWYKTGPDHCNAAARHLLLALVRHKTVDLTALAQKLG